MNYVASLVELHFIPVTVAQVWRVTLWAAELSLLTTLVGYVPHLWRSRRDGSYAQKEWEAWVMLGVFVLLARAVVVQAERWDDPIFLEELPISTFVVATWIRARRLRTGSWL